MKQFFQCKLALHFNTRSKAIEVEELIEAETEEEAKSKIMASTQDAILHPKKTVYIYSKEQEKYVPVVYDAEESDSRLASVDILSVKMSNICCFWGCPGKSIYIAKAYIDFISVKSIQYIAIGAKDFKEAYEILTASFLNPHEIANQLVLKKHLEFITELDYKHFSYDITSFNKSKLSMTSTPDKEV